MSPAGESHASMTANVRSADTGQAGNAIIGCDGLGHVYKKDKVASEILADVSFAATSGELISIVGASGCGKTTLLRILSGLIVPTSGSVYINGANIDGPAPEAVSMVFQEDALLPWINIHGNVELGLRAQRIPKDERKARASKWLYRVGLSGYEKSYPRELSGGMRQRAALARALCMEPGIMLLDEPFAALDEQTRNIMAEQLRALHLRLDGVMIMITHSLTEAVLLSDRVIAMGGRPGGIIREFPILLGRERSVEMTDSRDFVAVRHEIWSELRDEWTQTVSHIIDT